jgi:cold shock CspA family protein
LAETFGKKEVRNKKAKKRKDKEQRRLAKKEQGKSSLDDMIAYVDENGQITSTPPDLSNREEIDAESIEIGIPKKEDREEVDLTRKGKITKYDSAKAYGFIIDADSNESIFFHKLDFDNVEPKVGMQIQFLTEKGVKGLKAVDIKVMPEKK